MEPSLPSTTPPEPTDPNRESESLPNIASEVSPVSSEEDNTETRQDFASKIKSVYQTILLPYAQVFSIATLFLIFVGLLLFSNGTDKEAVVDNVPVISDFQNQQSEGQQQEVTENLEESDVDDSLDELQRTISGSLNNHDYVDLGLSVKWATCNIGANSPVEFGSKFAWGQTTPISNDNNYPFSYSCPSELLAKGVIDRKENLRAGYDAAHVNWGGKWRMPTAQEITELIEKCKWEKTQINKIRGYKVTGPNGNFIFLPATSSNSYGKGSYYSASNSERSCNLASTLFFNFEEISCACADRYVGESIRPVVK